MCSPKQDKRSFKRPLKVNGGGKLFCLGSKLKLNGSPFKRSKNGVNGLNIVNGTEINGFKWATI